jgi:branched-chain amino acid transport system permease protein
MIYLHFAILGLPAGAIYIALAAGLLVIYRTSGVINFAQGAIAVWGAYVYASLRTTGSLVLPIGTVSVTNGATPTVVAVLLGIACTVLIGLVLQFLVFRPMSNAPVLGQVVASVALMIGMESLVQLRFGANEVSARPILPAGSFNVGSLNVPWLDIGVALIALVLMIALWAFFRFTTIGIVSRASAANPTGATLMGFSPERVSAFAWGLSAGISGFLVMLAAPATGLEPDSYTLYVVPALAVLLVARMTSISLMVVGGIVLGCFQSIITLLSSQSWWPLWAQNGLQDSVPFVVIIVILLLFGKRLPSRGSLGTASLPAVRIPKLTLPRLVVAAVVGVLALVLTSGTYRFGVITSMALALVALSYVLLTGWVGQISLAQISFAGVAGFALSKITTNWDIPFPLSLIIAALMAMVAGMVVAVPAFRVRGAQLAVVTVAASVVIQEFVFGNPTFTPVAGLFVRSPTLFGMNLSVRSGSDVATLSFGFMVLVVLLLAGVGFILLARGECGRAFLAVRSNERAAASAGLAVSQIKLIAFALSGFIAGIAGGLIGYSQGELSYTSFTVFIGIEILAVAYLGGITSLLGALIAGTLAPLGIIYVLLNDQINFGQYYQLVAAIGLLVTAVLNPEGMAAKMSFDFTRLTARLSIPRLASGYALGRGGTKSVRHRAASVASRTPGRDMEEVEHAD